MKQKRSALRYIQDMRRLGAPFAFISKKLKSAGWDSTEIRRLLMQFSPHLRRTAKPVKRSIWKTRLIKVLGSALAIFAILVVSFLVLVVATPRWSIGQWWLGEVYSNSQKTLQDRPFVSDFNLADNSNVVISVGLQNNALYKPGLQGQYLLGSQSEGFLGTLGVNERRVPFTALFNESGVTLNAVLNEPVTTKISAPTATGFAVLGDFDDIDFERWVIQHTKLYAVYTQSTTLAESGLSQFVLKKKMLVDVWSKQIVFLKVDVLLPEISQVVQSLPTLGGFIVPQDQRSIFVEALKVRNGEQSTLCAVAKDYLESDLKQISCATDLGPVRYIIGETFAIYISGDCLAMNCSSFLPYINASSEFEAGDLELLFRPSGEGRSLTSLLAPGEAREVTPAEFFSLVVKNLTAD